MLGRDARAWGASVPWFLIILLALPLNSCALLLNGRQQLVPFSSQPQGAEVWIDGVFKGVTPIEVNLRRGEQRHVALLKLGDAEQTVILERGVTSASATGLIIEVAAGGALIILGTATSTGDEPSDGGLFADAGALVGGIVFASAAVSLVVDLSTGAYYEFDTGKKGVFVDFE